MFSGSTEKRWKRTRLAARLTPLVLLCLFFGLTPAFGVGGITVSQAVDKFDLAFEDSLHFEITLTWEGPQTAYLFPQPLQPTFERLRVKAFSSSISSTGSPPHEKTTKKYRYTLVPTSSGTATIDPVTVNYLSMPDSITGELVTEAMTVQIAEPLPPPKKSPSGWYWGIGGAIVVLLGVVLFLAVRRSARKRSETVEKSPVETFLEKLTAVKQDAGGDLKKFQDGLYKILVELLSTQYGINADELPDEELAPALASAGMSEEERMRISAWLIKARQDKFRPVVSSPGETIRLGTEIRQFFEKQRSST